MISAVHTPLTGRLNTLVISGRVEAGRAVLVPRGELVQGCADTLARTLDDLPADTGQVDLDMAQVVFMDTAGLQFLDLLDAYGHWRSIPVRATRWSGQPRRILELAGLDTADPLDRTARPADPDTESPEAESPDTEAPAVSAVAMERAEQLRLLRTEVEQLRRAIASRPVIDQARGILMATHACSSDEAWNILRQASQLSNTKLHTVAAAVTTGVGGDGPPPPQEVRRALRTAASRTLR
ncbi:ANTAR domain-containing protein [Streptomyces cylindrosporus]|uniref:ANTAR domain-containing protein n=1 Tax=Streptomyces cylindrosporus TaxID=2927583 RepID=A0ABS9XY56_9ACTN|nr:ANTAR domain-containing protein [Streptomyces cylindrosporus]MCI3269884.1 ANTAR domain-containing protein [Streptomyces cylindrosporus]